jgi:hypothetical protein
MGIFDRFRSKPADAAALDRELGQGLVQLVMKLLRDSDGRIHAEDAISAAATIVAERCIDAAGDFSLRDHEMVPGARVFSNRVNELICGDVAKGLAGVPSDSILGMLRAFLPATLYADEEFPSMEEVFKGFAAKIGKEDWGKVPLSVPKEHLPFIPPLRIGYESRDEVDRMLRDVGADKMRCVKIATICLAEFLKLVEGTMPHKVALTLAMETVNGMAKTAPMTRKAMEKVQREAGKG